MTTLPLQPMFWLEDKNGDLKLLPLANNCVQLLSHLCKHQPKQEAYTPAEYAHYLMLVGYPIADILHELRAQGMSTDIVDYLQSVIDMMTYLHDQSDRMQPLFPRHAGLPPLVWNAKHNDLTSQPNRHVRDLVQFACGDGRFHLERVLQLHCLPVSHTQIRDYLQLALLIGMPVSTLLNSHLMALSDITGEFGHRLQAAAERHFPNYTTKQE